MTDTLNAECRRVFEAKANHHYSVTRSEIGHYEDRDTEAAWQGWKTAWQYLMEVKRGEMRLLSHILPHSAKYEIADAIVTESRSKSDVVQDV